MKSDNSGDSASGNPRGTKSNSSTVTLNAFSRVIASVGLMFLFGFGGSWLDRQLGTSFLTISGFAFGGVLMLVGMLYAVKASEYERRQQKEVRSDSEDQAPVP